MKKLKNLRIQIGKWTIYSKITLRISLIILALLSVYIAQMSDIKNFELFHWQLSYALAMFLGHCVATILIVTP